MWKLFVNGNKQAFEEIMLENFKHLFNYGSKFSNDEELVKDVIQELFLKLWEKRANLNPLSNLMEAYQFTDGTTFSYTDARYDYTDLSKNRDPRLKYTILYDGAAVGNKRFVSHPDSATSTDQVQFPVTQASQTGYGQMKWIDPNFTWNLMTGYGANMVIIRYAEVLLSYLEAKMEAGESIDQALLDATINRVRGRLSVNMPRINQTNATLLRPILRNERRVELALEGTRLRDLFRWGIADQVLKGDFFGHPYPVSKRAIRKKNAAAPVDPFRRWYVTNKNFRKGIDETWPIPQAEVNINPKLGQ
ncbi:MAG TPA: RagB/SusD family nutrient uptake outer membrane protein [Sphingobacteriaceae bacterium]|nr:RagB/SusD family nutrient uptake outer membrane protein [Sphingobacteriaceae bacterium]